MSKSDAMETALLKLVFQAVSWSNVARTAGTPITSVQVSLHTADPTEAGTQASSEAAYGAYVRKAVARTATGWTVAAGVASPAANISFAEATSGTATITHFGIGTAASGAGELMYSGTVTPNIAVASGVTPILTTASTITES